MAKRPRREIIAQAWIARLVTAQTNPEGGADASLIHQAAEEIPAWFRHAELGYGWREPRSIEDTQRDLKRINAAHKAALERSEKAASAAVLKSARISAEQRRRAAQAILKSAHKAS